MKHQLQAEKKIVASIPGELLESILQGLARCNFSLLSSLIKVLFQGTELNPNFTEGKSCALN